MPLNIDIQQILLHILNFTVLFAAAYFLLYNPIKKFMEKRNDTFDQMNKTAESDMAEASRLKNEYLEKLDSLNKETSSIKTKAIEEAEAEAAKIKNEAADKAAQIIDNSKTKAKVEYDAIIRSAYKEITELTKEATEKMVFNSTSEAYDCFLDTVENGENE